MQLKIFIGLNNRFVLCEKFPDDEQHAGLHEMLEFIFEDGNTIDFKYDEKLKQDIPYIYEPGFYNAYFSVEVNNYWHPESCGDDAYLIINKVERIK